MTCSSRGWLLALSKIMATRVKYTVLPAIVRRRRGSNSESLALLLTMAVSTCWLEAVRIAVSSQSHVQAMLPRGLDTSPQISCSWPPSLRWRPQWKTPLKNSSNGGGLEPTASTKKTKSAAPKMVPKCVPSFRTRSADSLENKLFGPPWSEKRGHYASRFSGTQDRPQTGQQKSHKSNIFGKTSTRF